MADSQGYSFAATEFRIHADPADLAQARSKMGQFLEEIGMDKADVDAVILAVVEALTNTIRHGYGGPCQQDICIRIVPVIDHENDRHGMEFQIRDFGKQVDPETIIGRDLQDIRPGGLGVHIMRSVMDEVEYSCPTEGGMLLKMIKYFQSCPHCSRADSKTNGT